MNVVGGAVASWLVGSAPDHTVWVQALAGDIVMFCVLNGYQQI